MKRLPAVCGVVCLAVLVVGTGAAGGRSSGLIVGWGSQVVVEPSALEDLVAIGAGSTHSLGVKSDGTIAAWGRSDDGQCDVPAPNADFVGVGSATYHSLGIRNSDTPVETAFYATLTDGDRAVLLRWSLPSCCGGLGLLIYRARALDGPYSCITPEPLPDAAAGSYVDDTAWPGETFWYELRVLLASGEEALATDIRASVEVPGMPVFGIRYVMPNPATTRTTIGYTLPEGWRTARLSVHDIAGRLVRRLDPAPGARGFVAADWGGRAGSGEPVASGVYFVRLEADGEVATQSAVLLR